jgi:predicted transcriptional regulator
VTGRSSYKQTIDVLLAISEGKTSNEIKSSVKLSRYSFDYILNRLVNHELVESQGEVLVVTRKGLKVVIFLYENEKIPEDSVVSYAREHNVL